MAWIEAGVGVDDANARPREGIVTITGSFNEDLAEEEGEVRIAIRCEALTKAGLVFSRYGLVEVVVLEVGHVEGSFCRRQYVGCLR